MRPASFTILAGAFAWLCGALGVEAATLRERIIQNPHAEIEAAAQAWKELGDVYFVPEFLALDTCVVTIEIGSPENAFLDHFALIARYHAGAASGLAEAGYPAEAFGAVLDALTNARLDELLRRWREGLDLQDINGLREPVKPFERALVAALDGYNAAAGGNLPAPEPLIEACGGDYVGYVEVETDPGGGSVRLIGEYYFKLCEATGIEPYSDDCDKWVLAGRGQAFPIGSYRYTARWGEEPPECDRVMLDEPEAYSGEIGTFVIGRSGRPC